MDFQTMRIYGSIAIILGCFLFLYPKLLHPVFMSLLGLNTGTEGKKADDLIPPPLRDRHPGAGDLPEHIRKMRGPHPGMRAAAAEQSKQQTKGSGRGMMGVILPMYAVGIIVYLCYTLFKVFGKNDKSSEVRRSPAKEGAPRSGYSIGPEGDDQEEMDMRKLQERLAETEAQMTRILAAMQAVQTKVDDVAIEKPTKTVHQDKEEEAKLTSSDRSSESSPESESFEIVSKSDRDSGGEECRTRKVETLTSTAAEEQEKEEDEEVETEDDKQGEVDGKDEEPTEEIIRDKEDDEPEEEKTVRKRIPKTEHVES